MIKFPDTRRFDKINKLGSVEKKWYKLLEKALRLLGNFDENKPISIDDYNKYYENSIIDTNYVVQDNDGTIFNFYNFNSGTGPSLERFRKSYHLTMKRKNSNFSYKYNFINHDYGEFKQGIRMIKMSYPLSETRVITLTRNLNSRLVIGITENDKEYVLFYNDTSEEFDRYMIEHFPYMIEKTKQMNQLNLENIINIAIYPSKISACSILKDKKLLASIDLSEYHIKDENKEIRYKFYKNTREIIRENFQPYIEKVTLDDEKVQDDVKRLMKNL